MKSFGAAITQFEERPGRKNNADDSKAAMIDAFKEQLGSKNAADSKAAIKNALDLLEAQVEAEIIEAEKKARASSSPPSSAPVTVSRVFDAPSLLPRGTASVSKTPVGNSTDGDEGLSDYKPYPKSGASSSNSRVSSSTPVPVSGAFNTHPSETTNPHGGQYQNFDNETSPPTSHGAGGDYAYPTHPNHPSSFYENPNIHDHEHRASYASSRAPYYAPSYQNPPPYQNPLPPSNFVSYKSKTRITTFVEGELSGREFYNHNVIAFSDFPLDSTRTDFNPGKANHPAPRLLPNPLKHRFLVEPDKQPEPVATIIDLKTETFGPTDKEPLQPLVQQQITKEEYEKLKATKITLERELAESRKIMESTTLTNQNSTEPRTPELIIPNNGEENSTTPQNSKKMNLDTQNFSSIFTALAMACLPRTSALILKAVDTFHQNSPKKNTKEETAEVVAEVVTERKPPVLIEDLQATPPSNTPHPTGATHTASKQNALKVTSTITR